MATPETLRHYAHEVLELAASMEVDGCRPDIHARLRTAGHELLMQAAKRERMFEASDALNTWPAEPSTLCLDDPLPPVKYGTLGDMVDVIRSRAYIPSGEVRLGIEVRTGRWACCGAMPTAGGARPSSHFSFCENYVAEVAS